MTRRLRFLISAGPTREFLDPVRYLSNPSSGKMGIALASSAAQQGHAVTLVHGPCSVKLPKSPRIRLIGVTTAEEMRKAMIKAFRHDDVIIMAAAVTDFRARSALSHKMKKSAAGACTLRLEHTPDILAELGRRKKNAQTLIGFAAETQDLKRHALRKLRRKNLDGIVANAVGGKASAFGADSNRVLLMLRGGEVLRFPRMSKTRLAGKLMRHFTRIHLSARNLFS